MVSIAERGQVIKAMKPCAEASTRNGSFGVIETLEQSAGRRRHDGSDCSAALRAQFQGPCRSRVTLSTYLAEWRSDASRGDRSVEWSYKPVLPLFRRVDCEAERRLQQQDTPIRHSRSAAHGEDDIVCDEIR